VVSQDYLATIGGTPMCLGEVRAKLSTGAYATPDAVVYDLRLIMCVAWALDLCADGDATDSRG
jgi:hypothetical protein